MNSRTLETSDKKETVAQWMARRRAELRTYKRFVCYYYCNGWHFSLGLHISFEVPNIEIHLPCGFIRIGWVWGPRSGIEHPYRFLYRHWGWD